MGWKNTTLGSLLTNQEEIISVRIISIIDHAIINYGSCRRVLDTLGNMEEPLIDSFVDYYQSYLRGGYRELFLQTRFQNHQFFWSHLVSHCITYSISENYDVLNISSISLAIGIKGSHICFFKVFSLTNFFSFLLVVDLREVFWIVTVQSCTKSNNWLMSIMANIHTNQHSMLIS